MYRQQKFIGIQHSCSHAKVVAFWVAEYVLYIHFTSHIYAVCIKTSVSILADRPQWQRAARKQPRYPTYMSLGYLFHFIKTTSSCFGYIDPVNVFVDDVNKPLPRRHINIGWIIHSQQLQDQLVVSSGAVLADTSVRSPREAIVFIIRLIIG